MCDISKKITFQRDEKQEIRESTKNASTVGVTAGGSTKIAMITVLLAAMLCQALIQSYSVYKGRLQVDELVHQQQGAGQAGQAGFRATAVTARVAS